MSEVSPLFKQLVEVYSTLPIQFPQLKPVTVAQWMLESGRGTSALAVQHYNFGGLKYRPEMDGFAVKVQFLAHDGLDFYCRFLDLDDFCKGYWRFIARSPYQRFESHVVTAEAYINFISPIYAPSSATYASKVLALLPEATELLRTAGSPILEDLPEEPTAAETKHVIVIDPGHGGTTKVGGSSPNNATSASGVLEKSMTLELALLIKAEVETLSQRSDTLDIKVLLTRNNDVNVGLANRANVARDSKADLFLAIHFNGFNKIASGVETLILPKAKGNVNVAEDRAFAQRIQTAVFETLKQFRPQTNDRKVKEQSLAVLNDVSLGNSMSLHKTRACLVEVEFIDVPAVDALLNTGPNAAKVKQAVAAAIARALVESL